MSLDTNTSARGLRSYLIVVLLAIIFSSLLPVSTSHAQKNIPGSKQERKFALPSGPLLQAAPELSEWAITISYGDERQQTPRPAGAPPAPPPPAYLFTRPRKITTTKTGNIVHESMTDLKGRLSDRWFIGNVQYFKPAGVRSWDEKEPVLSQGGREDADYQPLPAKGFRDITWVADSSYAGTIKYGAYECLVFIPGGEQAIDLTKPEQVKTLWERNQMIACIDSRSRLPIAVRYLDEVRTFKWENPPSSSLTLPPDLTAQINKKKDDLATLLKRPPAP